MNERTTQYPAHLAKLVARRLVSTRGNPPPEAVLTRLLETLYFASLKTDEGRPILCTVNYVDPDEPRVDGNGDRPPDCWSHVPFERPLPFDVRTLEKLARAADPAVSSLAVYRDRRNKLFIWGMIDQEPRHSDHITLDATSSTPDRPGLFQATITGVGNISVYQDDELIGSLEQNTLVEEYHDVLWSGPVHDLLVGYLHSYLTDTAVAGAQPPPSALENELLMRWINSICRILMNIQHYRHGGGLLITPQTSLAGLNVKYKIHYDRLLRSLRSMVESQTGPEPPAVAQSTSADQQQAVLRYEEPGVSASARRLAARKNEVLGAIRFIAALSCVDGFVLLDERMVVHGFGVEVRTDNLLSDIHVARDSHADRRLLRKSELTQYGTRHRAMMRYCYDRPKSLGLVVSQDGDIRAMTRIEDMLVLWENIDVQLAYKPSGGHLSGQQPGPLLWRASARVA